MVNKKKPVRIALFGAAPDTPNMGVSALYMSTITGISKYIESVEFVVFDNSLGLRHSRITTPEGKDINLLNYGARGGHRYYMGENLSSMLFASKLGKFGAYLNQGISLIDSCDAVLDISGGDSFSDIYGAKRFNNINTPKIIAVNRHKPLVFLPQTYGPFKSAQTRSKAAKSVKNASMAWARDRDSFSALKLLIESDFNPKCHLSGVDMAFGLQPTPAEHLLSAELKEWISRTGEQAPVIGFNVSGLIYNDPNGAKENYGFVADYKKVVHEFLAMVLAKTSARIILISHVMDLPGHYESDLGACIDTAKFLELSYKGRVIAAPTTFDQSQVKWLISKMDWFCGTRMHSTIASLSCGVPTAAISYSYKTKGVFETCGQADHVMDPREKTNEEILNGLWNSLEMREASKRSLDECLPAVFACLDRQLQLIVSKILADE